MKQTLRGWNSTLRPSAKPIARTVINRVSAKRKVENAVRRKVLAELKRLYPMCQRCGVRPSEEGHEPLTRARGGSITDPANIVMLCAFPDGGCHKWVHEHIAEATKEGWLVSRWAK